MGPAFYRLGRKIIYRGADLNAWEEANRVDPARGGRHNFRVYGAPDYFRARGMPTHPTELQDHDCIRFTPPGSMACLP